MANDYVTLTSPGQACKTNFRRVPESSEWNSSLDQELKLHRIHAYPAKFPAFIPTKAFAFAKAEGVEVRKVADVFCGCGTVPFEARRSGIAFWGCDINPVATLIAATKSSNFRRVLVDRYTDRIVQCYAEASPSPNLERAAIRRLRYWYSRGQFRNLAKLLNAIRSAVPARSHYGSFFLCAFSNILKSTSRWLTKSIKPQIDPNKRPAGVLSAFHRQVRAMIAAFEQSGCYGTTLAEIVTGNLLELEDTPRDIDMIVTSPPYVTSYEYADLHQLSSLWLGYASDYRQLRKGSIGTATTTSNFNRTVKTINSVGTRVVFQLFDKSASIARATANYYIDMQAAAERCFGLLRDGGLALFVIGDTEYLGVHIENAAHLTESLLTSGFISVRVAKRRVSGKILTPYRNDAGRFSRSSAGKHVYANEFVVIARK